MSTAPDIATVLACAIGAIPAHKLQALSARLERAVGRPLTSVRLDDANIVRQRLREQLRTEGATLGMVQSYEQLFMGIVRRAAVSGVVDAPPEGPWTTEWQSVLDVADVPPKHAKTKAAVRSLAAWATAQGVSPADVDVRHLELWVTSMAIHEQAPREKAELALSAWRAHGSAYNDQTRRKRLLRKAQSGSVKHAASI